MLDRQSQVRVAWVAALAVLVMVGVVASALAFKHTADDDGTDDGSPRSKTWVHGAGPSRTDRNIPVPAGCEVDPKTPPSLAIDLPENRLDIGAVRQGVHIERDVTVRNVGTGTLCVYEPDTGCGCLKATWVGEDHRVAPGATGTIHLVVNTADREGHQDKVVTLRTNDPKTPNGVQFRVTLEIRRGLMVTTASNFGRHAPNTPGELTIRIKCPVSEPEWQILSLEGSRKTAFTWKLTRVEPGDKDFRLYDLKVVHPGLPASEASSVNTHNEEVKVRTSHPERPEFSFMTQILVLTKYFTSPPTVRLGYVGPTVPDRAVSVQVMSAETGVEFALKDARIEGSGFEMAGPPKRLKEGWGVDVKYDGKNRQAGSIEATLVVSFEDADFPELRIPVLATVKAKAD